MTIAGTRQKPTRVAAPARMPELDDRSGSVAPETTKLILSKATVGRKCYLPDLADFKGPDLLVMNATLRD